MGNGSEERTPLVTGEWNPWPWVQAALVATRAHTGRIWHRFLLCPYQASCRPSASPMASILPGTLRGQPQKRTLSRRWRSALWQLNKSHSVPKPHRHTWSFWCWHTGPSKLLANNTGQSTKGKWNVRASRSLPLPSPMTLAKCTDDGRLWVSPISVKAHV